MSKTWVRLVSASLAALYAATSFGADRSPIAGSKKDLGVAHEAGMLARYQPTNDGYRIIGSQQIFNRAIYGGHSQDDLKNHYYTFAGDLPIVMGSIVTTEGGGSNAKCGTLMMGLSQAYDADCPNKYGAAAYGAWFHECRDVVATFHGSWWEYELSPLLLSAPEVDANVEVLPLQAEDGFVVHLRITPQSELVFCAAFGGITDRLGLITNRGNLARNFSAANCKGNVITCGSNRASLDGPHSKMWLGTDFDAEFSVADAHDAQVGPTRFLSRNSDPAAAPMLRVSHRIGAGETFEGSIVVVRGDAEDKLDALLARKNATTDLKEELQQKEAALRVDTPDHMLNLTVPVNVVGMDACWNKNVFCHGGANWHSPYAGWRICYGPTVLGWHDRVVSHFLTHAAPDRFTVDPEHGDGYISPDLHGRGFGYNMQEVAIDMLLHNLEWTKDLTVAKQTFERLSQALRFESRAFDPDNNGLYQNFLNTWVSDGHPYNGGECSQASAYNYRANRLMALIAKELGLDASPFTARASQIHDAMQNTLWLPESGVFAEYQDTLGDRLMHPSPELATIYHTIECGLADPFQAYQMLRFTRTELRNEQTLPRKGRLVWSSNWYPRSFSACGLFAGENIHLAWAYFENGQTVEAMELLRGIVDAHFMGDSPGSIGHFLNSTGSSDGTQDFADTTSMYLRLVVEGLFGVQFHLLEDRINVSPNFPSEWTHARLEAKDFSTTYSRDGRHEQLEFTCDKPAKRVLQLPMRGLSVTSVTLNGKPADYRIEPRIGRSDIVVETTQVGSVTLDVSHGEGSTPELNYAAEASVDEILTFSLSGGQIIEVKDPSGALSDTEVGETSVRGKCSGTPGNHTVFLRVHADAWEGWLPASFNIASKSAAPRSTPHGDLTPLDISAHFNASLKDIHQRDYESPRPSGISLMANRNGRYAWDDNNLGGPRTARVDDDLLRKADGRFVIRSGVPFDTPPDGPNVVCVSQWDNFPNEVTFEINDQGSELAIMLIGVTNPMQSRVENGRIEVVYADDTRETVKLVNPVNFDDWMVTPTQRENETVHFSDVNHAIVQKIILNESKKVESVVVRGTANEVIVGVLGISLAK